MLFITEPSLLPQDGETFEEVSWTLMHNGTTVTEAVESSETHTWLVPGCCKSPGPENKRGSVRWPIPRAQPSYVLITWVCVCTRQQLLQNNTRTLAFQSHDNSLVVPGL